LKPIVLSRYNEALIQYPDEHDDSKELQKTGCVNTCIGVHQHCDGLVDLREVSNTHNAIVCRDCGLRVVVPKGLKTYGSLRHHMSSTLRL